MLHKILHNLNHPLHCKLHKFAKPIHISSAIARQNGRAFVVAKYNTYQFSLCFNYTSIQLWNSLPKETVLCIKQDRFIALAKKVFVNQYLVLILNLSWKKLSTHPFYKKLKLYCETKGFLINVILS